MYILTHDEKQIINSDFVERFCISVKDDAALIVASYGADRPPVTLTRCKHLNEARETLNALLYALSGRQSYYTMPESLLYAEELAKKDARVKRKGGS